MKDRLWQRFDLGFAVGGGVLYGITAQLVARLDLFVPFFVVMSFGYVFVMPLVLGYIAGSAVRPERGLGTRLLTALGTSALCLLVAGLLGWEGAICLVMAAPVYLPLALVGGLIAHRRRPTARRPQHTVWSIAAVGALPLTSGLLESQFAAGSQFRTVANSIEVRASAEAVWRQIERVPPIVEPQESFFFTMGFPRPIEATLSHEGVGGVRHARFERGLTFIETVTEWSPPHTLRFSIAADPRQTPLTTLDTHVTVGGRYFDVLEGRYQIVPLDGGRVRLELTSQHRISTHFNFYASLWSDLLMSEIQRNILAVLRDRCEHGVGRAVQ